MVNVTGKPYYSAGWGWKDVRGLTARPLRTQGPQDDIFDSCDVTTDTPLYPGGASDTVMSDKPNPTNDPAPVHASSVLTTIINGKTCAKPTGLRAAFLKLSG